MSPIQVEIGNVENEKRHGRFRKIACERYETGFDRTASAPQTQADALELRVRTWGGRREGAGRPKTGRAVVPHRCRQIIGKTSPVHVTLKVADHVYNLGAGARLQ